MELPGLGLKVAKRQVLADEVTDNIRAAILSRQLKPVQKLAEDELALQIGVSRGPIREALARLEREGLVVMERHKGARVASWTLRDVEEIYGMRGALEELAIEWACQNATAEQITEMKRIIETWERIPSKQRTSQAVSRLDLEFHTVLFKSAHHTRLLIAWEGLRSQMHAFLAYALAESENSKGDYRPTWGDDHSVIVGLIEGKKISAAKKEIRRHVEGGYQLVAVLFENNEKSLHPWYGETRTEA